MASHPWFLEDDIQEIIIMTVVLWLPLVFSWLAIMSLRKNPTHNRPTAPFTRLPRRDDYKVLLSYSKRVHSRHSNKLLTSHIYRLPSEILSDIFLHAAQGQMDIVSNDHIRALNPLDPDAVPWLLRRVCRQWRQVAEATPQIWRVVDVHITDEHLQAMAVEPYKHVSQAQNRIITWLELGRKNLRPENLVTARNGMQVAVRFGKAGPKGTGDRPSMDHIATYCQFAILSTLLAYSEHWRLLRLEVHFDLLRTLGPFPKGRVKRLESLHFHVRGMSMIAIPQFRETIEIFREAPNLRSLEISGLIRSFWDQLPLPWHQIEDCNLKEVGGYVHQNEMLLAMKAGTAMTRCRVLAGVLDAEQLTGESIITNNSLKRLEYHSICGGARINRNDGHTFQYLNFPNLTALHLGVYADRGSYAAAAEMIRRSEARVSALDLRRPYAEEVNDLEQLLDCTANSLKSFKIHLSFKDQDVATTAEQTLKLLMRTVLREQTRCEHLTLVFITPFDLAEYTQHEPNTQYDAYVPLFVELARGVERARDPGIIVDVLIQGRGTVLGQVIENALKGAPSSSKRASRIKVSYMDYSYNAYPQ
ncbi:hypothetical protein Moror_16992 [Moniliophthora roreri MCA 2997]|uniref:Uncharacterized protein n=2 Tax=Moniliophthora roreri TaxID=221103 RepID=V2WRI4_MONRO|nr:hypothetical protein Moror_16992 [Moniliophthora roreri MCA 2997]KAI3595896.1 hypothetical protein WG66_008880 [Moniliophthora roreri]